MLNLDDPNLQGLIPHLKKRLITYGLTAQADVRAVDIKPVAVVGGLVGSSYQLLWKDAELVEVKLAAAGRHNVYNSLAAAAVALSSTSPRRSLPRPWAPSRVSTAGCR